MKRTLAILALSLAAPAAAQSPDWAGVWAYDPDICQWADQIGEHDPAPVGITETKIIGLENICDITSVTDSGTDAAWLLTLSCSGEGEHYQDTTILMLEDPDTLWRWYGGGAPGRYTRCPQ